MALPKHNNTLNLIILVNQRKEFCLSLLINCIGLALSYHLADVFSVELLERHRGEPLNFIKVFVDEPRIHRQAGFDARFDSTHFQRSHASKAVTNHGQLA